LKFQAQDAGRAPIHELNLHIHLCVPPCPLWFFNCPTPPIMIHTMKRSPRPLKAQDTEGAQTHTPNPAQIQIRVNQCESVSEKKEPRARSVIRLLAPRCICPPLTPAPSAKRRPATSPTKPRTSTSVPFVPSVAFQLSPLFLITNARAVGCITN